MKGRDGHRRQPLLAPGMRTGQPYTGADLRRDALAGVLLSALLVPAGMGYAEVAGLLGEHDEDLARWGGYLASTSSARHALEEPVLTRLGHRIPWLLVGLAGAIAAAGIVGGAEDQLNRDVLLAFFVPGIVYMADAVGTQTEALVIRGLSVGVSIRSIIWRELLTGALVGAALAAAFVPVGIALWGQSDIAIAVGVAMFAACSIATVVAMALPGALHWLGRDPAFGSGPLATVIQDLLSLVIYFAVASAIVG